MLLCVKRQGRPAEGRLRNPPLEELGGGRAAETLRPLEGDQTGTP